MGNLAFVAPGPKASGIATLAGGSLILLHPAFHLTSIVMVKHVSSGNGAMGILGARVIVDGQCVVSSIQAGSGIGIEGSDRNQFAWAVFEPTI
jgi:hypothetical protein